jgi:hypothetical protein
MLTVHYKVCLNNIEIDNFQTCIVTIYLICILIILFVIKLWPYIANWYLLFYELLG